MSLLFYFRKTERAYISHVRAAQDWQSALLGCYFTYKCETLPNAVISQKIFNTHFFLHPSYVFTFSFGPNLIFSGLEQLNHCIIIYLSFSILIVPYHRSGWYQKILPTAGQSWTKSLYRGDNHGSTGIYHTWQEPRCRLGWGRGYEEAWRLYVHKRWHNGC